MNDEFYMQLALNKAWEFQILTYPNPTVGCVITDRNGKILSCEAHKKAGCLHAEPMAVFFALCALSDEFLARFLDAYGAKFSQNFNGLDELKSAELEPNFTYEFILAHHANLLKDAKAYVTLEPCSHHGRTPPCAELLKRLNFSEVVIGARDENEIASGGAKILKDSGVCVRFDVLKDKALELIAPFRAWQDGNFSFLKIALSANGVANGGVISGEQSRTHVHRLRSVIDLLVIGGNTVRKDRPRLDTRLINGGKNPDVLIFSRRQKFDESIPLFKVPGREVKISDSLGIDAKLVMYEGAQCFLNMAAKREIPNLKWLLIYQSPNFKDGENLKIGLNLRPIFRGSLGDDIYTWCEILA
ncbi:bifunctional diaminohydroxyphosphoribosylaminopyrimidine deaminase/5-amino-6-(5-phosphoribosylamino)uracil reductase RibD [Campylobacter sp.]|uniref:bifunctional diaminohydroxyphosphoribosylaminopyrimidine deaminase/5-amino-6-(5-phosphoribosylamino)uracil reductase RibD n=1 Tax=Campylobacter sp. TaxID=205 RepID=UPI00290F37AF|nr:bifunctional diaminohydroxyphosphoribosylaminopyrimidine deaminase/5-amino-6-(5-phosphoribosylamino)uracil reductase RibD [Campylobacter sp.]MDU6827028.1 bifunctional diaminohydroxyphosphoribosylaminopyrimidine deaminase/5-amino-6-(5-phosphoribosylamino)uracil reductase RibD [Campylobacter sp.]